MSGPVLVLIVFLLLAAIVVVVYLIRNSGKNLDARGRLGPMDVHFSVTGPVREQANEYLGAAADEKDDHNDLHAAREVVSRLDRVPARRILWVDDAPDGNVNEVLMLLTLGFQVVQATTSRAARRYLDHGGFDYLITDLSRRGDSEEGMRLLASLRRDAVSLPTIVYSEHPGNRGQRAMAEGATVVTSNPSQLLQSLLGFALEGGDGQERPSGGAWR